MSFVHDLVPVPSSGMEWFLVLFGLVSANFVYAYHLSDNMETVFSGRGERLVRPLGSSDIEYLLYRTVVSFYVVFLHPLSKYPGPRLWALSTIPYDIHFWRGNLPYAVCELHERYGPVVRITPNELSYITEDAWNDIYGKFPGKPQLVKKAPITGRLPKVRGLFTTTSDTDHARMRRNFSHSFSEKALREQEPIMKVYFDLLIQRLIQNCAAPVDIVMWYNSTTFDIIGDLLFGQSYGCLEKSRLHTWVAVIFEHIKGMRILGLLKMIEPLDKVLLSMLPMDMKKRGDKFRDFQLTRLNQRLEEETPRLDFMSYVQKTYNTPEGMTFDEIRQTCNLFVIAGSETTATLLSGVTYFLLKNPSAYQKLVNEVRQTFASEENITISSVQGLKYELAVLEEALRIFPPVAGTQCRIVPPTGHMIAGKFVPGNTVVGINQWSAYHSTSNFKNAHKFIPERWLGDPEYKDDKRKVLQPFSVGPRNCIGQNLAYAEMRVILARILWNFDLELCDGGRDWMERLEIYSIWKKAPLMVKLIPVDRTLSS